MASEVENEGPHLVGVPDEEALLPVVDLHRYDDGVTRVHDRRAVTRPQYLRKNAQTHNHGLFKCAQTKSVNQETEPDSRLGWWRHRSR